MSWDLMCDEIGKCECGKGNTRYIRRMDDWNRTEETECIDCKECYEKYLKYQENRNNCQNTAKHDYTRYIYVEDVKNCR